MSDIPLDIGGVPIPDTVANSVDTANRALNWLKGITPQPIKAAGNMAVQSAQPVMSALGYLFDRGVEAPVHAITGGLNAAEQGKNPIPAALNNVTRNSDVSWRDFIQNSPDMGYNPPAIKQAGADLMGAGANIGLDPVWLMHGVGYTKYGEDLAKEGNAARTLKEAVNPEVKPIPYNPQTSAELNTEMRFAPTKRLVKNYLTQYYGNGGGRLKTVYAPVDILKNLPGEEGEMPGSTPASMSRLNSLKDLMETGRLPYDAEDGIGQLNPEIVVKNGSAFISNGNHRIRAASQLGWDEIPIEVKYEGKIPKNGNFSPKNLIRGDIQSKSNFSKKVRDILNKPAPPIADKLPPQRDLLTIAGKPVLPTFSKPALSALTDLNKTLSPVTSKFQAYPDNPELYKAFKQISYNPVNQGTIDANNLNATRQSVLKDLSKETGKTPEELQYTLRDLIEKPYGPVNQAPPVLQRMARDMKAENRRFASTEGMQSNSQYLEHNATPEWMQFRDKTFPKEQQNAVDKAVSAVRRDANQTRETSKGLTTNQVNDAFMSGNGDKVPGFEGIPQMKNFRQPMFNMDTVNTQTKRNLENLKVTSEKDFYDHVAKNYGTDQQTAIQIMKNDPQQASMLKEVQRPQWVSPKNPEGKMYFTPQIADDLTRIKSLSQPGFMDNVIPKFWKTLNQTIKVEAFGLEPASIARIWMGNQGLAFTSGFWSPGSQLNAAKIAENMRLGKLNDGIAAVSPKLGALSQKEVLQLAKENAGYGMGQAQMEVPEKGLAGTSKIGNAVKRVASPVLSPKGFLPRNAWKAHQFVEDATRLGTFINALEKGYSPYAAGEIAQKVNYNYSIRSAVDKFGRQLHPFWMFWRNNMESMMKNAIKNPGPSFLPFKITQETNRPIKQEDKYNSPYQAQANPMFVGKSDSGKNLETNILNKLFPFMDINSQFGTGRNLSEILSSTPKAALNKEISMINPLIRTPLEMLTNYSSFAGRPIEKMPGEVAPLFGHNVNRRFVQYPAQQLRPIKGSDWMMNDSQPLLNRLLSGGTGIDVKEVDPEKEKDFFMLHQKADLKGSRVPGDKDLMKFYLRMYERDKNAGNNPQANADNANAILAQELLNQKLKDLVQ